MSLFKPKFDPDTHRVGFCKFPKPDRLLGSVLQGRTRAVPLSVLCLSSATRTEDQGSTPMCAAYSAASMAENIKWRIDGHIPDNIDPERLYAYAKSIDGDPKGDGTTLTAILTALLEHGVFSRDKCRVRTLVSPFDVKSAIHRYNCCLVGLNITDEWYKGREDISSLNARYVGGHAVQAVGYDQTGCWVQNSWGVKWGRGGFARVAWPAFERQFMYGAVLTGCLKDME